MTTTDDNKQIKYFLTGSHIYGVTNDDSDIDIVVHPDDFRAYKKHLKDKGIETESILPEVDRDYMGYYYTLGGIKFNIISLDTEHDFDSWAYATKMMVKEKPIEDKAARRLKFQLFINKYFRDEVINGLSGGINESDQS